MPQRLGWVFRLAHPGRGIFRMRRHEMSIGFDRQPSDDRAWGMAPIFGIGRDAGPRRFPGS